MKGVRKPPKGTPLTSPIPGSDYDYVLVIVFGSRFEILHGLMIPRDVVEAMYAIKPKKNYRQISVKRELLRHPAVEHIDLNPAFERFCATA